jgi:hypothetical protein
MAPKRIALWAAVALGGGLAFNLLGLYLNEFAHVYSVHHDHRNVYYNAPSDPRGYLLWGVVALVVGAIAYAIVRRHAVLVAFLVCLSSTAIFFAVGLVRGEPLWVGLLLYTVPFVSLLVFSPTGTLLASRLVRPNTSLERTRDR